MSDELSPKEAEKQALLFYTVVACAAAGLMVVPLMSRIGTWALVPPFLGVCAVLLRWRSGALLVLGGYIFLGALTMTGRRPWRSYRSAYFGLRRSELIPDLFLALCFLVLLIAYFRLLGISRNLFPTDRRWKRYRASVSKRRRSKLPPDEHRRSPLLVRTEEGVGLLLTALLIVSIAQLVWIWLSRRSSIVDLSRLTGRSWDSVRLHSGFWQLLVLLWVGGLMLLVLSGFLGYLGSLRMRREEARMVLQDEMWKETRREQSRIQRWISWGNLKRRHRGG